jgi:hypothetical protein
MGTPKRGLPRLHRCRLQPLLQFRLQLQTLTVGMTHPRAVVVLQAVVLQVLQVVVVALPVVALQDLPVLQEEVVSLQWFQVVQHQ